MFRSSCGCYDRPDKVAWGFSPHGFIMMSKRSLAQANGLLIAPLFIKVSYSPVTETAPR